MSKLKLAKLGTSADLTHWKDQLPAVVATLQEAGGWY